MFKVLIHVRSIFVATKTIDCNFQRADTIHETRNALETRVQYSVLKFCFKHYYLFSSKQAKFISSSVKHRSDRCTFKRLSTIRRKN